VRTTRCGRLYVRADTSPDETCPTCGDQLFYLRWCHEERCVRFAARRRAMRIVIGLALLGFGVGFLAPFAS